MNKDRFLRVSTTTLKLLKDGITLDGREIPQDIVGKDPVVELSDNEIYFSKNAVLFLITELSCLMED